MAPPSSVVSQARAFALPMLKRLGNGLLDAVLPPRCIGCGAIIEAAAGLCPNCWPKVRFIAEPMCAACGMPFEFDAAEGSLCGACAAGERAYERVRAAIAYDDGSRPFILGFKHGDRTDFVRVLAPWMLRAGRALLADADVLVPVPLHWTRLFARKYNQAGLLAQAVARLAGAEVAVDALVRRKRTPSLAKTSGVQRAQTVRGAFVVPDRRRRLIEGRRVLLIDDVYTTGSTTGACARALRAGGARTIDVLTLARVVRPAAASSLQVTPTRPFL